MTHIVYFFSGYHQWADQNGTDAAAAAADVQPASDGLPEPEHVPRTHQHLPHHQHQHPHRRTADEPAPAGSLQPVPGEHESGAGRQVRSRCRHHDQQPQHGAGHHRGGRCDAQRERQRQFGFDNLNHHQCAEYLHRHHKGNNLTLQINLRRFCIGSDCFIPKWFDFVNCQKQLWSQCHFLVFSSLLVYQPCISKECIGRSKGRSNITSPTVNALRPVLSKFGVRWKSNSTFIYFIYFPLGAKLLKKHYMDWEVIKNAAEM